MPGAPRRGRRRKHGEPARTAPRIAGRSTWAQVNGTGKTGRIRERDVAAVAGFAKPQAPAKVKISAATTLDASQFATSSRSSLAVSPIRKTIAARMSAGVHETGAR